MLAFLNLGKDTIFSDSLLEAAECSIDCLVFANFCFRHQFSLPPSRPSKKDNTVHHI